MTFTWINPAEIDKVNYETKFRISHDSNTDQYGNHCRDWRAEHEATDSVDRIVVHSGTDGISLAVQGSNNGYVHLNKTLALALIAELKHSIKYSQTWGQRFKSYWRRRNSLWKTYS